MALAILSPYRPRSPQGQALDRGDFIVTEELELWVKGRRRDMAFEIGYDNHNEIPVSYRIHPAVPLTYLGLFRQRTTLAEFQLGSWPTIPNAQTMRVLVELLSCLEGVRPLPVDRPHTPLHLTPLTQEELRLARGETLATTRRTGRPGRRHRRAGGRS